MKRRLCIATFVVLAAALPSSGRAQSFDQVAPLRGTPTNGKIVEMSPTEVVVESRGARQRIPVNEIKRVSFAEDPPELRRARDQILTGQLASGLADLKRIDPDSIDRAAVRHDLQYYTAYGEGRLALSGGGDKTAAAAAMMNFVRTHSNSYHFFEAAELLGDLAVSLESYDNATKYYSAIATKAPWPDYQMRAAIREARALASQDKHGEALSKYEEIIQLNVDTPEALRQKRLAEVGRAASLAESGRLDEAKQLLQDLIAKHDPQDAELFGRAYNALGQAHLQAAETQEALLAYLHTDILFYKEPDVHAEALYHLSKLWSTVKESDRALGARSLLTGRYAGSRWARLE